MRKQIIFYVAVALISSQSVLSQELKAPPKSKMDQISEEVFEKSFEQLIKVYTDPRFTDMQATYYKNLYEALVSKGFTKDQSFRIVLESVDAEKSVNMNK